MTTSVRRFAAHEWRLYRDLRLRALSDSPDAFGSTFAHESKRTEAEWEARLARGAGSAREFPMIAEVDGGPAGLAWARMDDGRSDLAHLFQVWVAPERRRAGIGAALLDAAVAWARSIDVRVLALAVTCGDNPAHRLYTRAGFTAVGDPQPLRPESAVHSQTMHLALDRAGE